MNNELELVTNCGLMVWIVDRPITAI